MGVRRLLILASLAIGLLAGFALAQPSRRERARHERVTLVFDARTLHDARVALNAARRSRRLADGGAPGIELVTMDHDAARALANVVLSGLSIGREYPRVPKNER